MVGDLEHPITRSRPGWLATLAVACVATAVAMVLQDVVRNTWQVRSLPERVEDWLLLFVPLDLFEQGLAQFGADAKVIALDGTIVGMAAVLLIVGIIVLRRNLHSAAILGVGLGMWLFTMVVIMPVTGAGLFATGLLISPLLTDAGYLSVFLGYATVLVVGRALFTRSLTGTAPEVMYERRALLTGVLGTLIAGAAATIVGREGSVVASSLPLASAPTAAAPSPRPTETSQAAAEATAPAETTPEPVAAPPTAAPAATPTPVPLPNPPVARHLTRDQDGSLTAAGRPKGQLSPPITSNDDFYIVTKNAVSDPTVDAASWRLVVDGEVNNPVQLDYRTLLALPAVEITKTLECISNLTAACNLTSFGCDLLSTARFRGARLSDVIALAGGLKPTAMGLALFSTDEFSAGLPTDVIQDPQTLVVYEMNDQPLPREHGFPARLLVPGRYGMKNPKWLAGIRAMDAAYAGWYEQRGWNKDGIVKTMSRIDTPADGGMLPPGDQTVAGIAYAGDRGVMRVEVSTDATTWQTAPFIEPMQDTDTMVRWQTTFSMPATGSVTLTVRATDGTGAVQTDEFVLPQPDGASGQDSIQVNAA